MSADHGPTAQVCGLLDALLAHGGLMNARELEGRVGVHKDTVARICAELTTRGWVELETVAGVRHWRLGPALPRIGLTHLARLTAQQEALHERYQAALPAQPEQP